MSHTENLESRLISIRRYLHQYPELSREEFETTKAIKLWLEEAGIELRESKLSTGVFADINGRKPGPVIAIRADIDALPIEEQSGVSFSSKIKGKMHACGHDFHTAALVGAAYLLSDAREELTGTIRLLFQPAEELGGGAELVLGDGQLEGVQAIIGLHNKPDLPVGTIGLKEGPLMAAVDRFYVKIRGKGSHAALPHSGNDPITATAHIITSLQTIVSRSISSLESAVVSVTRISGGETWNVIPEDVIVEGTIRTIDKAIRSEVKEKFYSIVTHTATAFSQDVTIEWYPGPPALSNHKRITDLVEKTAKNLGLNVIVPEPSMAGEDFSLYLDQVPGTFAFFGTSGNEDWHHPAFTIDESALIKAAYFLTQSARDLLDLLHFDN
ncbi:amidohydrolase [Cytobacillus sp. Hz8]|uniref:amidohydrolase n=1 Tax=Cytobacillus sp. Hz8 TaxID=3347168 RepID=UPI0035DAD4B3